MNILKNFFVHSVYSKHLATTFLAEENLLTTEEIEVIKYFAYLMKVGEVCTGKLAGLAEEVYEIGEKILSIFTSGKDGEIDINTIQKQIDEDYETVEQLEKYIDNSDDFSEISDYLTEVGSLLIDIKENEEGLEDFFIKVVNFSEELGRLKTLQEVLKDCKN